MTAAKCRDCDRPISSRDALKRERGSQCWRDHLAALGITLLGRGRRNWNPDMPGQEELGLEEEPCDVGSGAEPGTASSTYPAESAPDAAAHSHPAGTAITSGPTPRAARRNSPTANRYALPATF